MYKLLSLALYLQNGPEETFSNVKNSDFAMSEIFFKSPTKKTVYLGFWNKGVSMNLKHC